MVRVFGCWSILRPGRAPLAGQFHHNDGDGGGTIGDPDCADVGDDDAGGGDGVYGMSACSDLFCA